MKTVKLFLLLLVFQNFINNIFAQETITPFYSTTTKGDIKKVADKISANLLKNSFLILGSYNPGKRDDMYVITYTSQALINITTTVPQKGIFASVLRVGFQQIGSEILISFLNPEYLFEAFVNQGLNAEQKRDLQTISKLAFSSVTEQGYTLQPTSLKIQKSLLANYKYKEGSPDVNQLNIIKEFPDFNTALEVVRTNLNARKNENINVFEIVVDEKNTALFGVGMQHISKGEAACIDIFSDVRIASLPMEILIIDNKVCALDRAYRIPLFEPEIQQANFSNFLRLSKIIDEQFQIVTKQ